MLSSSGFWTSSWRYWVSNWMLRGGVSFGDINLEAICLERVTEAIDMEDIKPIIWLKHVLETWKFWLLNTWKGIFPPYSPISSDPFKYIELCGPAEPGWRVWSTQPSHFSDKQTHLETEVAATKLEPRTPDCCLIQSLLYIPREILKAYIVCYLVVEKNAWLPCQSETPYKEMGLIYNLTEIIVEIIFVRST